MADTAAQLYQPHLLDNRIDIIDGFRGIAILLVTGYHYLPFFSFGWIGVDLFFVISGFLITGKLIESLGSKNYLSSFYLKRALRIIPLYYFVLVIFFVLLPKLIPSFVSGSFHDLLRRQEYYWAFTVNFYDAFYGWPVNVIMVPMWSLACEMQFYLVWPLVVLFLYRIGKMHFIICLVAFIFIAVLYRCYGNYSEKLSSAFSYVLLPARLDEFSIGALLYIFLNEKRFTKFLKHGWIYSFVSLLLAFLIIFFEGRGWHLDARLVSKFGYTLNAVGWAGLIGYVKMGNNHFVVRISKCQWLLIAGKYSYGIYILHVPVKIILLKLCGNPALSSSSYYFIILLALAVTLIFSFLSFHLLEKKFLHFKFWFG